MKMTINIFCIVLLGIVISYYCIPINFSRYNDILINLTLTLTIFFIGIGIGQNKQIFKNFKKRDIDILLLPLGTIIGSLIGGVVTGIILKRSLTMSLAIASGFGWYSISAGLLYPVGGAEVATVGFLSNVFREMIAFVFIPLFAKKLSPYTAISIGGATTMDTTLPLISSSATEKFVLISFIHGALLSFLVPFFVQFFANL